LKTYELIRQNHEGEILSFKIFEAGSAKAAKKLAALLVLSEEERAHSGSSLLWNRQDVKSFPPSHWARKVKLVFWRAIPSLGEGQSCILELSQEPKSESFVCIK
tara:strand:+ start:5674 stop:5985 length:312 start_codon:yes stop_codon:yes gene_type:complete